MNPPHHAATVDGIDVSVADIDAREAELRRTLPASSLPRPGTSEGRQMRRWLTQLVVTERVIAGEAAAAGVAAAGVGGAARGVAADRPPTEDDLLPDMSARLEIGSVAAAALADPLARAMFVHVTAGVDVTDAEIADYHRRNPLRFATSHRAGNGWRTTRLDAPPLDSIRPALVDHLRGAARRRAFRVWLDARRAASVRLAPGYEHPGDPRQPDNTHRH
jgi:[acyl-carrier-protein] S-malonyltransferase